MSKLTKLIIFALMVTLLGLISLNLATSKKEDVKPIEQQMKIIDQKIDGLNDKIKERNSEIKNLNDK